MKHDIFQGIFGLEMLDGELLLMETLFVVLVLSVRQIYSVTPTNIAWYMDAGGRRMLVGSCLVDHLLDLLIQGHTTILEQLLWKDLLGVEGSDGYHSMQICDLL